MEDFEIHEGVLCYYNGPGGDVVIPDGVTAIGHFAFQGCEDLTSVVIPDSVTSIGQEVFYDCALLTSVTLPKGLTTIGSSAFHGCHGLADSEGFVIINGILFEYIGSSGTVVIPDTVTAIGALAFSNCIDLTSITIPDHVTYIGDFAFSGCEHLTQIIIPDGIHAIPSWTFQGCRSLHRVTIPKSVQHIGEWAFFGCKSLTSLIIPGDAVTIEAAAFDGCHNLTDVRVSGVLSIRGYNAFSHCEHIIITAPQTPASLFEKRKLLLPALLGYLHHPEVYQDPEILQEYQDYLKPKARKLLLQVFKEDLHQGLQAYQAAGIITPENFESVFLRPALKANAAGCIAYLLEWKRQHLPHQLPTDLNL